VWVRRSLHKRNQREGGKRGLTNTQISKNTVVKQSFSREFFFQSKRGGRAHSNAPEGGGKIGKEGGVFRGHPIGKGQFSGFVGQNVQAKGLRKGDAQGKKQTI